MKVVMIIFVVVVFVFILKVVIYSCLFFFQMVKDCYLIGYVIDCLKVFSILLCVQFCLKRCLLCCLINYRDEDGKMICELNDKRLESVGIDFFFFVFMLGFIFVQFFNFEVCIDMIVLK